METTKETEIPVVPKLFYLLNDAAGTALLYLFETKVKAEDGDQGNIYNFVTNRQQQFSKIMKTMTRKIEINDLYNPTQLDVSALCTLLLGFFEKADNQPLSPDETNAVRDIKDIRNKIAHVGSGGGERQTFLNLWTDLVRRIDIIVGSLDLNQEQEVQRKIDRATTGTELSISLKSIEQLEEFKNVNKDMIEICRKLETQYAAETTSQALEMARLVKKFPEQAEILRKILEETTKGCSFGKMLPTKKTLGIKFMIHTESKEDTDNFSRILVDLFDRVKENKPGIETSVELVDAVKSFMANIQGQHGVSSVQALKGSVKLAIDMQSPTGILDLFKYLESDEAGDVLQTISKKLGQSVTITAELEESSIVSITETLDNPEQEEDLSEKDVCDKHPSDKYTGYCEDHMELVCKQCTLTDHKNCEITDLEKKSETLDDQSVKENIRRANDLEGALVTIEKEINESFNKFKGEENEDNRYLESLREDLHDKLKLEERKLKEARIQRRIDSNRSLSEQAFKRKAVKMQKDALQKSTSKKERFIQVEKSNKMMKNVNKDVKRIRKEVNALKTTIKPVEQYKKTEKFYDLPERIMQLNAKRTTMKTLSLYREPDIDLPGSWITGCIIHDNRSLVLCDRLGSKLIMLSLDNTSYHFDLKLESSPHGIARMNEMNADIVLVTMPEIKKYLKVRIDNSQRKMSIVESFQIDEKGYGIASCGDKIFICCRDESEHGHVEVREKESGRLLETLGKGLLSWPKDVKLSKDEKRLYLCDSGSGCLSCLSLGGRPIFETAVDGSPSGLAVDDDDTVLVCQTTKHQVSAIYRDGVSRDILPTGDDGIVNPASIDHQNETLVIGMKGGCKVYTTLI